MPPLERARRLASGRFRGEGGFPAVGVLSRSRSSVPYDWVIARQLGRKATLFKARPVGGPRGS
jgi:hypothetical protein